MLKWFERLGARYFTSFMDSSVAKLRADPSFNNWLEVQWNGLHQLQGERTLGENHDLQYEFSNYLNKNGGAANFENRWE